MGCYYDRNGSPVSGILAEMAYERGSLSLASKMRYEADMEGFKKEEKFIKDILKDREVKPIKIEFTPTSIDFLFDKPKKIKPKNLWEI